jgi:ABC-2 type transport system ATP-binding protein
LRIELDDVRKQFRGALALNGVSLEIATGSRVALVGPNGSGKSTLARALMGMLRCEGSVRLDEWDAFRDRAQVAHRTAYVPQAQPQLGATVGEITEAVTRLRGLDPARIRAVADELQLDVDAVAGRPVRVLSGGMKQKLLIALALAAPSSLLVMDEPTASLDARTRETFFRLFEEHLPGATLLLSSHRLEEVGRLVDRVVFLEEGRVTLDAAVGDPDVRRRMGGA